MRNPKPHITRSRSGCSTCRRRHIKCDEAKPHCQTCRRLGIPCEGYESAFIFRDDTRAVQRRVQRLSKPKGRVLVRAREPSLMHHDGASLEPSRIPGIDDDVPVARSRSGVPERGNSSGRFRVSPLPPTISELNIHFSSLASSHNAKPPSCGSGDAVGDTWLSQNFPSSLPSIFREIWEGVGCSYPALRLSLLAFAALHKTDPEIGLNYPKNAVGLYSCALQAMAEGMPSHPANATVLDAVVLLAILTLLSMLEMSFGSFLGGITHCKQAHNMIETHIQQLGSWETGCRMIRAWVPIKCWYSLQCVPWEDISYPPPVRVREALWDILSTSMASSGTLLALLCTARKLSMQLMFCRLVGTDVSSEAYRSWSRQVQSIGNGEPSREAFATMSGQDLNEGLALVRARLDQWHDHQQVSDMPIVKATSVPQQTQLLLPPFIQAGPLFFQSTQSASNYLRYLAAQALASTQWLEHILSCQPVDKLQADRWICLTLQALAGLSQPLQEVGITVGLAWILLNVILLHGPDPDTLDCLENALPSLGQLEDSRCALCPLWIIRDSICKVREESSRGRIVLHVESGIQASEEPSTSRSTPVEYQVVLLGYDVTEQAMFHTLG